LGCQQGTTNIETKESEQRFDQIFDRSCPLQSVAVKELCGEEQQGYFVFAPQSYFKLSFEKNCAWMNAETIPISKTANRAWMIIDADDVLGVLLSDFGRYILRDQRLLVGQLDEPLAPIINHLQRRFSLGFLKSLLNFSVFHPSNKRDSCPNQFHYPERPRPL
jgi:hypothetical protein